jgi:hypothetical protein
MRRLFRYVLLAALLVPAFACSDLTMPTAVPNSPTTCATSCGPLDEMGPGGSSSNLLKEEFRF